MRMWLALAILLLPGAPDAQRIHRCVDAQGLQIFTDQPCEAHAARRWDPATGAAVPADGPSPDDALHGRCPAPDTAALLDAMDRIFARHDVNALAGLYHWSGDHRRSADAVLAQLQALVERPLLAAALEDPLLSPDDTDTPLPLLRLELGGRTALDDPLWVRFRLHPRAQCLWLTLAAD